MYVGQRYRPIRSALVVAVLCVALMAVLCSPAAVDAQDGQRMRVWHFAEGLTRADFRNYFLVHNLVNRPTSVRAEYQREDGLTVTQHFGVPANGRVSIGSGDLLGPTAFGVSFYADGEIVVERSTLAGADNEGFGQDGLSTLGYAPRDLRTWHFADGNTYGMTQTYYVLRNLSDEPTSVRATFVTDIGTIVEQSLDLAPRARIALGTRDLLPHRAFGATFEADQDIVAERTVYFEGPMSPLGGLGYPSSAGGATTWYFAEGNTRHPYTTFLTFFNPGPEPADVEIVLSGEQGGRTSLELGGFERRSFNAAAVLPASSFATSIFASRPIVVERSYFSTGDSLYGTIGHAPGTTADGTRWYFSDGNTTGEVETYFILRNLTQSVGTVEASFFGGPTGARRVMEIGPYARDVFRASDVVGQSTFATTFTSDVALVVERVIHYPGWGAHGVVGVGVEAGAGSTGP